MLSPAQVDEIFTDAQNPSPFAEKRVLELYLIRPAEDLFTSGLEFRPIIMAQMMEMGREAAERALEQGPLVT